MIASSVLTIFGGLFMVPIHSLSSPHHPGPVQLPTFSPNRSWISAAGGKLIVGNFLAQGPNSPSLALTWVNFLPSFQPKRRCISSTTSVSWQWLCPLALSASSNTSLSSSVKMAKFQVKRYKQPSGNRIPCTTRLRIQEWASSRTFYHLDWHNNLPSSPWTCRMWQSRQRKPCLWHYRSRLSTRGCLWNRVCSFVCRRLENSYRRVGYWKFHQCLVLPPQIGRLALWGRWLTRTYLVIIVLGSGKVCSQTIFWCSCGSFRKNVNSRLAVETEISLPEILDANMAQC